MFDRRLLIFASALLTGIAAQGQTLYVSPAGNDTYPGTVDSSFKSIPKAISLAVPGTTIYVRQGTYPISSVISITSSGSRTDTCKLLAYPGERAVIDGSPMPVGGSNRGVALSGNSDTGLQVDNGTSFNRIINCVSLGPEGSLASFAVQTTNSWAPPFVVTDGDFQSIDTSGVLGAT
jgi:hypothetical protein